MSKKLYEEKRAHSIIIQNMVIREKMKERFDIKLPPLSSITKKEIIGNKEFREIYFWLNEQLKIDRINYCYYLIRLGKKKEAYLEINASLLPKKLKDKLKKKEKEYKKYLKMPKKTLAERKKELKKEIEELNKKAGLKK